MSRYKICVYAICKDEEQFVDRWMDSMGEADLVVVTDTGSRDGTVERLRGREAVVCEEIVSPWRFDVARNLALSHLPEDVDIAVCTDLDEVFRPGWRAQLEAAWTADATMGNYLYNWSLRADGTPDTQFVYFKVHTRRGYRWDCPVHEHLSYVGEGGERTVFIPGMVLDHYPDQEKSRGSYLPLLEMAVEEDPLSDRMAYYLGREYMYAGRWQSCIDALERHLDLPTALWREERCASMRWIAESCCRLGRIEDAYRWYYRAVAEAPHMREPYVELARLAYSRGDLVTVFYMTAEALKITEKSQTYVNMGYCWNHLPDDLAAIACYQLGLYRRALSHAERALAASPEDERLQNNLASIAKKLRETPESTSMGNAESRPCQPVGRGGQ